MVGHGDRERLVPQREARRRFWVRHARLGVALSAVFLTQVTLYAWLGTSRPSRVLLDLVVAGVVLTIAAAFVAPVAIGRSWRMLFFYAWSVAASGLILAAASIDGGERSPITFALYLPLLYAALAYPPPVVLSLGALTTVGYVMLAANDRSPSDAYTALAATTLAVAALMAARAAGNRAKTDEAMAALAQRLRAEATRDPLTGVLNRRGFDVSLEHELERVRRYARPLAMLLIDLDRLKAINDVQGHDAGDVALGRVASALLAAARRSDVVARVGGDEFAVIAPETGQQDALALAGRIHDEVQRLAGADPLTVSIGVRAVANAGSADDLFRSTDRALYAAKQAGRNCTRLYVPASARPVVADSGH